VAWGQLGSLRYRCPQHIARLPDLVLRREIDREVTGQHHADDRIYPFDNSAVVSPVGFRGRDAQGVVRRGSYLPLLAPTVGAGLLIYDLRTPRRFYSMFRIAKGTSPMRLAWRV